MRIREFLEDSPIITFFLFTVACLSSIIAVISACIVVSNKSEAYLFKAKVEAIAAHVSPQDLVKIIQELKK